MRFVCADGLNGFEVETLYVVQFVQKSFGKHIHEISGNSARSETALYSLGYHEVLYVVCNSQTCAACARLHGKTLFYQSEFVQQLRRHAGNFKTDGIFGDFGRSGNDSFRVADCVNRENVVYVFSVQLRILNFVHHIVGYENHFVGVHKVAYGVAQTSACAFAHGACSVAVFIHCGNAQNCNVDVQITRFDCLRTSAVSVHYAQALQFAVTDRFGYGTVYVVRVNFGNVTVFHKFHQNCVAGENRAGGKRHIFKVTTLDFFRNHVQNVVAVTKMVMEGQSHSVVNVQFVKQVGNACKFAETFRRGFFGDKFAGFALKSTAALKRLVPLRDESIDAVIHCCHL